LKPIYAEAAAGDCVAAWLERPAGRAPLKRIDDHPTQVAALPCGPLTGEAAAVARGLAERIDDVRIAAAVLRGAAVKATIAIDGRLLPPLPAGAGGRAVLDPLRRIVDACGAFEDALAAAEEGSTVGGEDFEGARLRRAAYALDPHVALAVAEAEAVRASLPDRATRETIAVVARTIAAVRPSAEALARVSPALTRMPNLPALPAMNDGPPALSVYELEKLERAGLGLPPFSATA
jgi:hypothetical protein